MFGTSLPVTSGGFHDRAVELATLQKVIDRLLSGSPAWLAIVGLRKVGKTSLLLEAARRNRDSGVRFVILDTFESGGSPLEFFRLYAARVLDVILGHELGVSLEPVLRSPADFRAGLLRSSSFNKLPPSTRAALAELPGAKADAALARLALELPEQAARALDLRVLVAIDEFQELASTADQRGQTDVLALARAVWQRHERVSYVVSGSARTMLESMVTSEGSPFFQHFSLMDLGPFTREEAVQLLVKACPEGREIPRDLAAKGVEVIGSHPFYVQLLGEALTSEPPPYDDSHLKVAVQQLLFSRTGRLGLYFEREFRRIAGRSTYLAAVLEILAGGPLRLTDISKRSGAPSGAVSQYLERLGDAARRREDGLYELSDPTFGLWLKWRQPGGTVTPMRLLGDEAEIRVAEQMARLGFDLVYQSRGSRGSFDLLAVRGADQLGVQVKRSGLPVRFTRAAWNCMVSDSRRFDWDWVVAAVAPGGEVLLLDPRRAVRGKEIRLTEKAVIENFLGWLERRR